MLQQVLSVTVMNLKNLRARPWISAVVVVGIGGVVAVLLGLLAMSQGFTRTFENTVFEDRGLIIRKGNNEMDGWISNEEAAAIRTYDGFATISPEVYLTLNALDRNGDRADIIGRGLGSEGFALRPEIRIVAGKNFAPGTAEVIVGAAAARQFSNLALGDQIESRTMTFTVVGHFTAGNSAAESEIWIDLNTAKDAFKRNAASILRVQLTPDQNDMAGKFERLNKQLQDDPRVTATLFSETEFFAQRAANRAGLINTFAFLIAGIMAIGSIITALNTMFSAVGQRNREIATLRALGFHPIAIVCSVIVEAMVLALIGAASAALLVYVAVDGMPMLSTTEEGAQMAFAFSVSSDMLLTGFLWALALGLAGGSLPAIRAARLPICTALRDV